MPIFRSISVVLLCTSLSACALQVVEPVQVRNSKITVPPISVTSAVLNNQTLTISGTNLGNVTQVVLKNGATTIPLQVTPVSSTSFYANATGAAISLVAGTLYNLVISTANADTTVPFSYDLTQVPANGLVVGTNQLVVSGGNVGIGTTNPQAALEIATPNESIHMYRNVDTIGSPQLRFRKTRGTYAAPTPATDGDRLGYLSFDTIIPGPVYQERAWMKAEVNGTVSGSTIPTDLMFGTASSTTPIERMRIDSNGNVGIGMSNPKMMLDILGGTRVSSGGGDATTAFTIGQVGLFGGGYGSPVAGKLVFGTDGSGWQFNIAKRTGTTETDIMTFRDSGNVGIGTPTPLAKLTVVGGFHLEGGNGDVTGNSVLDLSDCLKIGQISAGIMIPTDAEFAAADISGDGLVDNLDYQLCGQIVVGLITLAQAHQRGKIGLYQHVFHDGNGNVGIGNTAPKTQLDVTGDIRVAKHSSAPFACDAAHDVSVAITSGYRQCVCNGGTATWVFTSDGSTTCVW